MGFSIIRTFQDVANYLQDGEYLQKELIVDTVYTIFALVVLAFIVIMFVVETGVNIMHMLENPIEYYKGIFRLVGQMLPIKTLILLAAWMFVIGPLAAWHYYYLTNVIALFPKKKWDDLLAPVFAPDLLERLKGVILWSLYNYALAAVVVILMALTIWIMGQDLKGLALSLIWPLVLLPFWLYVPQLYFLHKLYNKSNMLALWKALQDVLFHYPKFALLTLLVNLAVFLGGIVVGIVSLVLKGTMVGAIPSLAWDYLTGWYLAQIPRTATVSAFKQLHWQASD